MALFTGTFKKVYTAPDTVDGRTHSFTYDGANFWTVSSQRRLYRINPDTFEFTEVGRFPANFRSPSTGAMVWDGTNLIIAHNDRQRFYTVSRDDATLTQLSPTAWTGNQTFVGMAWDGTTLWASGTLFGREELYRVNRSNGALTKVQNFSYEGSFTLSHAPWGMAWDGEQVVALYRTNHPSNNNILVSINTSNAVITRIGNANNFGISGDSGENGRGLAWDDSKKLYIISYERISSSDRATILLADLVPPPTYTAPTDKQTILEGREYSIDLSNHFTNASSYALQGTNEDYVSISGSVISFTAPMVSQNTDITLNFRASNASGNTDESITVVIRDTPPPPTYTAPTDRQVILEGEDYSLDLSTLFANADSYALQGTNPAYVSIDDADLEFTAPQVSEDTDITVNVRATNDGGNTDAAIIITIINILPPEKVSGVVVRDITQTGFFISWSKALYATSYQVSIDSGRTFRDTKELELRIAGARPNTDYFVVVRGINSQSTGVSSDLIRVRTLARIPSGLVYDIKVNYSAIPNLFEIRSVSADDNALYFLLRATNDENVYRFMKYDKEGNILFNFRINHRFSSIAVDQRLSGLALAGTPLQMLSVYWRGSTIDFSDPMNPSFVDLGIWIITVDTIRGALGSETRVGNDENLFVPGLIFHFPDANNPYVLISEARTGSRRHIRAYFLNQAFAYSGVSVELPRDIPLIEGNDIVHVAAHSRDKIWVSSNEKDRQILTLDVNFGDTNKNQTFYEIPDNENLIGLAHSAGQLIGITDKSFYFYGERDADPDDLAPEPTQQLFLDSKYYETFDVVRPGNPIKIIALNQRMIRQTSTSLVDVGSTRTIQEQLENIEITPEYTIPTIQENDKIFKHEGEPNLAPTKIPDDAFTVEGIISAGNSQRQSFVCK